MPKCKSEWAIVNGQWCIVNSDSIHGYSAWHFVGMEFPIDYSPLPIDLKNSYEKFKQNIKFASSKNISLINA
jgi:hypothetical protein